MSDATTIVKVECGQCGRFLGQQVMFLGFGPLPERIYQTCAACEAHQADVDAVLEAALDDRPRGRGAE